MKLLVTGASGFIGSNFIKHFNLTKEGSITVYGVGRYHLLSKSEYFIPIEMDLSIPGWIEKLPKNIDVVVHLAQSKNYRNFPQGAQDMFSINIGSTFQLLEWSRKNGIKQFIFASTGNVYQQKKEKLLEDDICLPLGFYAASKYAAEVLCRQYASFFNITILRLFGVYGPSQKNGLIPTLIEKIKKDQTIQVADGIGLYLSPLFIDDCISMVQVIVNAKSWKKEIEIYNLAGDESLSLRQIASIIGEKLHKRIKYALSKNPPLYFLGANYLFKSRFGYILPLLQFESGIAKCI